MKNTKDSHIKYDDMNSMILNIRKPYISSNERLTTGE